MDARVFIYKAIRKVWRKLSAVVWRARTSAAFMASGVKYFDFRTTGVPIVKVAKDGNMSIGRGFVMNNGLAGNWIGSCEPCMFVVAKGCSLAIGDNVGISQSALVACADIVVENNVKIGGGVAVFTTDFHSLDPVIRASPEDTAHKVCKPVRICEGAFIGARSMILKGVTIGRNSIIGCASVVTKSVPDNEIWAGNPAKFIRKVE